MSGKVIIRCGITDPDYFVCDGAQRDCPRMSPVQSTAHRFDDFDSARAKIAELSAAGYAWAKRLRPVRLSGVRTVRRTRAGASPS